MYSCRNAVVIPLGFSKCKRPNFLPTFWTDGTIHKTKCTFGTKKRKLVCRTSSPLIFCIQSTYCMVPGLFFYFWVLWPGMCHYSCLHNCFIKASWVVYGVYCKILFLAFWQVISINVPFSPAPDSQSLHCFVCFLFRFFLTSILNFIKQ